MDEDKVFHNGEIALQERTGDRARAIRNGVGIRDSILPAAGVFLTEQQVVAVAAHMADGRLWTSLWFGDAGFLAEKNEHTLTLVRALHRSHAADPILPALRPGAEVGMLAIDLDTRRRYRINGVVAAIDAVGIDIAVRQAFGNCPKYIQQRWLVPEIAAPADASIKAGARLDRACVDAIAAADTVFVASRHPARGLDASHRGGEAGFVRVVNERTLRIPDYPGNGLYNTLGNFAIDSTAALVIPDFNRSRLLHLAGTASLSFDADDPSHPTKGTGRYWEFQLAQWMEYAMPMSCRWKLIERSPYNPAPYRRDLA